MLSLSNREARKLVLVSQGIHRESDFGRGTTALLSAMQRLSYVQIDTISVVARAHHHTLWNRVNNYSASQLDAAVARRDVFEYWSHAAAYLPMRDYRFSLPRKQAFAEGEEHWYARDPKQMKAVLERIKVEGPLQAKDFDQMRENSDHAWGGHKPAKKALEQLFMQGELMVSQRKGFQKVFDLSERVVPVDVNQSMPNAQEYHNHLIVNYLLANGLGTAAEISYLRKGIKPLVYARCLELVESGRLVNVDVCGRGYFALAEFETFLHKKISRRKVKILSPFDNVLIQRQRMRDFFDFDYQIECYVTPKKRKYGYFVLPILFGQEFAGRMDAKIDRKTGVLCVSNLYLEMRNSADFFEPFIKALKLFQDFNGGSKTVIQNVFLNGLKVKPAELKLGF